MSNPAIVIAAYNRPEALSRLLASIQQGEYPASQQIPLHISIDSGGNPQVLDLATRFEWTHGTKEVVHQTEHLGLVQHVLKMGDLTEEYGSIIFLEDDLAVSPKFYSYALQASNYYQNDEDIAGISLYNLWFNGYTHLPFTPLSDGSDVFFLQVPFFLGQILFSRDWIRFREWMKTGNIHPVSGDPLHEMFLSFDLEDWFPIRMKYLVESNLYYVFPRVSLATGYGDAGSHFSKSTRFFQIPLLSGDKDFRFKSFTESQAVYDSFYEILPDRLNQLTIELLGFSYDVDLNATKSEKNLNQEYVLTTQSCKSKIKSFGLQLYPIEANVIESIPGTEISFCRKTDLNLNWLSKAATEKNISDYYLRDRQIPRRQQVLFFIIDLIAKLKKS